MKASMPEENGEKSPEQISIFCTKSKPNSKKDHNWLNVNVHIHVCTSNILSKNISSSGSEFSSEFSAQFSSSNGIHAISSYVITHDTTPRASRQKTNVSEF